MSDEGTKQHPVVFVSYSHDSREHKMWVAEFAGRLIENGIEVILDQWDVEPGDDLAAFMERSVMAADRVLMICTEKYVQKANDGVGGVGYEKMIVTGQLVQQIGSRKFIPIVRQSSETKAVPTFMSGRLWVDPETEEGFKQLLHTIHQVPAVRKPALGKNPFETGPPSASSPVKAIKLKAIAEIPSDATATYEQALEILQAGDMLVWRKFVQKNRLLLEKQAAEWEGPNRDALASELPDPQGLVLRYTRDLEPLYALTIASVESADGRFTSQAAFIDDLLNPPGWNRSGPLSVVELPEAAAFIYHALYGAISLQTIQGELAIRIAKQPVSLPFNRPTPVIDVSHIVGWPHSLAGNCRVAWRFLMDLPDHWPWLTAAFGSKRDYQSAVSAYYMLLNVLEFADTIATQEGRSAVGESNPLIFGVPLMFQSEPETTRKGGYQVLVRSAGVVRDELTIPELTGSDILKLWDRWITHCQNWISHRFPFSHEPLAHRGIVAAVVALR